VLVECLLSSTQLHPAPPNSSKKKGKEIRKEIEKKENKWYWPGYEKIRT
jgi:hypothetical protein